jgi:hypothetical protein
MSVGFLSPARNENPPGSTRLEESEMPPGRIRRREFKFPQLVDDLEVVAVNTGSSRILQSPTLPIGPKMKRLLPALLGITLTFPVGAQSVAFSLNDLTTLSTNADGGTGGLLFTVGTSCLQLTSLGYFDANQDGLSVPHEVGIFDASTRRLLTSVVVPTIGATLRDGFQYEAITPLTLLPGRQYLLAAEDAARNVDPQNISGVFVHGAALSLSGYYFTNSPPNLVFPTTPFSTPYADANFTYQVIPEPSTFAVLAGFAALGFAFVRRRNPD